MAGTTLESLTTFGELLRYLRRQAGMTQAELGQAVSYSAAQIGRLESGRRRPDMLAVKTTFVEALGIGHASEQAKRLIALATAARDESFAKSMESGEQKRTNLPAPLTSFIGREREIEEVMRLLGSSRLVTLTGTGGVGKTRLALEVGAKPLRGASLPQHPLTFPDGVWLVEFAPLSDPELAARAVARVFALPEQAGHPYVEALCAHLGCKQLLLILDNCEHLIQACADLSETLLRACPHLRILATSRESLNVPGEVAWRVPPLTTYEGVSLFVERVRAIRPDFNLGDPAIATVTSICDQLDGIPLALELAAARLRVLTLEQIASRLGNRLRLLSGGTRTTLPRQQTLRATIAWSYDLLSEGERALLRRLSVFAGGWTLEAAEAVATEALSGEGSVRVAGQVRKGAGAWDVLNLLDALVSKSLVLAYEGKEAGAGADGSVGVGDMRYRMLETIREYAREQLVACGEEEPTRRLHAAFYLLLVDGNAPGSLRPPGSPLRYTMGARSMPWLKQLEMEHANLREALTWSLREAHDVELGVQLAIGLFEFWDALGSHGEGHDWLECALVQLNPGNHTLSRARLLGELAIFAGDAGEYARSITMGQEALAICREKGALEDLVGALWVLTDAEVKFGHYSEGQIYGEECLAVARELGDLRYCSVILSYLSQIAVALANIPRAVTLCDEELRVAESLGDNTRVMVALFGLADIATNQGDLDRATALHSRALAYFQEIGWNNAAACVLQCMGRVALLQGNIREARMLYQKALRLWHDYGYSDVHRIVESLAGLAATSGDAQRALSLWASAGAIRAASGSPELWSVYRGRVDAACAQLDQDEQEVAEAAGRAMRIEAAIEYALGE